MRRNFYKYIIEGKVKTSLSFPNYSPLMNADSKLRIKARASLKNFQVCEHSCVHVCVYIQYA